MAQAVRVGILGAGWPGLKHAEGYRAAGGFEIAAVADRIPARRKAVVEASPKAREFADAADLLKDAEVDVVSLCLPNDLHAPVALAALKAGKHVVCETPPALNAAEAKKIAAAAEKAGKTLLYAAQRRFGGAEQASKQAISKGYIGDAYHARAAWMRTRGIPWGTGWFTDRARSGGGALIDLGVQMLDLAWHLLGQPKPLNAFSLTQQRFGGLAPSGGTYDVEDAAFALVRFEGNKSLEMSVSWAIDQPPRQQGTACRIHGDAGAVDVYTPAGPLLYRQFTAKGEAKETPLKLPKTTHYTAMMRHLRACIQDGTAPACGPAEGVVLMQMIDALYKAPNPARRSRSGKKSTVRVPEQATHHGRLQNNRAASIVWATR